MFCPNRQFLTADTRRCMRLIWDLVINTDCANSHGPIAGCSIDSKLGYILNVSSTSLSRCRLLKIDSQAKLNSAS